MYVNFAQRLIWKVVWNNSINGLQYYSLKIFISRCYRWHTSNGSWGLFCVLFCHSRLRPPHTDPYEELYGETKIKPHNLSYNYCLQYLIIQFLDEFCDSVGQWILFCVSSWHLKCEATWFLHDSQLFARPKTQLCGYAEWARANKMMVIGVILHTRVPLESLKNK